MAERLRAVDGGFTDEDRKVLITTAVKVDRLEADSRDGLLRIAKLEVDRVTRKDMEDLLAVIDEKTEENTALLRQSAATQVRLAELEKIVPQVETLKKYLWMGLGALAVLEFVFTRILK